MRTFQSQVNKWMEILECHRVTGSDSFIMKARVVSVEHLERFLDRPGPLWNHVDLDRAFFPGAAEDNY